MRQMRICFFSLLVGFWITGNALAAVDNLNRQMEKWTQLTTAAQTAAEAQDYPTALRKAEEAFAFAKAQFGSNSKPAVQSIWQLAKLHSHSDDLTQAKEWMQKALKLAQEAYGNQEKTYEVMLDLGNLYGLDGEFAKAEGLFAKVYGFYNAKLGPHSETTLNALTRLAEAREAQGNLDGAEKLLAQGYRSLGQIEIQDANLLFALLDQLASVKKKQGNFAAAEELYQQLLEQQKSILGPKEMEVYLTLRNQAELYKLMGKLDRAKELLMEVIPALSEALGGQDPDVMLAKSILGQTEEALGSYEEAERLLAEVYQFDKEYYGDTNLNTAIDLNNLAGVLRIQGKYEASERSYKQAHKTMAAILGQSHPETLSVMNNLGLLYENRGFYDLAEPLMKEAYQKTREALGPANPKSLAMANNLAMLYESQGVFEKSAPLYEEIIALAQAAYGDKDERTSSFRNNLAYLYLIKQDYARSAPEFAQVRQLWEAQWGLRHQNTLKALNNQGRALHGLGELEPAQQALTQALQLRKEVLGADHPDVVRSMVDLGDLFITRKNYVEAETQLREAWQLSDRVLGKTHPYTFDAINNLSRAEQQAGKRQTALLTAYEGFQRRNDFFQNVLWVTGENTRQGYLSLHRPEQDHLLALLAEEGHQVAPLLALEVSLKRKGLLLKISSEIRKVVALQDDPKLKALADRLQASRKQLADFALKGPSGLTEAQFKMEVQNLENAVFETESQLGQASRNFRDAIRPVGVDDLIPSLKADHALIDFLIYHNGVEDQLMAVILTKDSQRCWFVLQCDTPLAEIVPLGSLKKITAATQEFRDAIMDDAADEDMLADAGSWIFDLVWKPLEPKLRGRSQVYVVPDGVINILPMDAIPHETKGGHLIEHYTLKYLSSARDLVLPAPETSDGQFVILAGPDYDIDVVPAQAREEAVSRSRSAVKEGIKISPNGLRSLSFDPLLGAKVEGETILGVAEAKKASTSFTTGPKAEEQRLREWQMPPRVLHVATHGFFLKEDERLKQRLTAISRGGAIKPPPPGDNPLLRAGLAFAGINANAPLLGEIESDNDGVLTAMEVLGLDLYGTEMVVLSACETGLGEVHAGEGVYGLRRAFQEAGVNRVVNSLWEVSDDATRDLMTAFYDRVLTGMPARQALHEAQLSLLQSDSWYHPYYWSAFQMVERNE